MSPNGCGAATVTPSGAARVTSPEPGKDPPGNILPLVVEPLAQNARDILDQ